MVLEPAKVESGYASSSAGLCLDEEKGRAFRLDDIHWRRISANLAVVLRERKLEVEHCHVLP